MTDNTPYFEANLARWDESVDIHVASTTGIYKVAEFKAGVDILAPIESREVGDIVGKDVLHLQCHFGLDTLALARRGAWVTGLDFSPKAIAAAQDLSAETGVPGRFVEGNLYDAPDLIEGQFDLVYVTWGALIWLPDLVRWAQIVAHFLRPGGQLYLLEGHPAAFTLEEGCDGRLSPKYPYFTDGKVQVWDTDLTYTDDTTKLMHTKSYEWSHPLSDILNAILGAGLRLDWFHEHDRLVWKLYPSMILDEDGQTRLPDGGPSLPLAFSLKATKP